MVVNLEKYNILKKTKTKLGNEVSLIGDENIPPNSDISLIIGGFHGDEPQGKFLIEKYLKQLSSTPTSKSKISVLPRGEDILFLFEFFRLHHLNFDVFRYSRNEQL